MFGLAEMLGIKSDPERGGTYVVAELDLLVSGEQHRVPMRFDSGSNGFACTGCRAVIAALGLQVSHLRCVWSYRDHFQRA
jgi:hypothetical protein